MALGGDRRTISILALNLHEFYAQYSEKVQAALRAGLSPVEKHLQASPSKRFHFERARHPQNPAGTSMA